MGPNKYQIVLIGIVAVLWLGVGNLIILDALRRKGLSPIHLLNPFVLFRLEAKDWGKIILLLIVVVALSCSIPLLGSK